MTETRPFTRSILQALVDGDLYVFPVAAWAEVGLVTQRVVDTDRKPPKDRTSITLPLRWEVNATVLIAPEDAIQAFVVLLRDDDQLEETKLTCPVYGHGLDGRMVGLDVMLSGSLDLELGHPWQVHFGVTASEELLEALPSQEEIQERVDQIPEGRV